MLKVHARQSTTMHAKEQMFQEFNSGDDGELKE